MKTSVKGYINIDKFSYTNILNCTEVLNMVELFKLVYRGMNNLNILFNNYYYLYLLAYFILPICIIYKVKTYKCSEFNDTFFDRDQTNILKGIFIIMVMLAHLTQRMPKLQFLVPLTLLGNMANIMFLFISGYSIMESFKFKEDYLKNFITKRLSRIYKPFLIVNIFIYIFYQAFFYEKYSLKSLVITSLKIKYIDTQSSLWYIIATFLFYLFFYLTFRYIPKIMSILTLFIVSIVYIYVCKHLKLGIWWYNTAFCFPLGVLFSNYKEIILNFIKRNYLVMLFISILGFSITFISFIYPVKYQLRINILSGLLFILLILVINLKVKFFSRILEFLGRISYEMYLVHMMLLTSYFRIIKINESYSIYFFIIVSIIMALCLKKISNFDLKLNYIKIKNKDSEIV